MRSGARGIGLSLLAMALFAISACSTIERNHGYVPLDEDLDAIIVGVDTKATVADTVGRPSAAGILSDGGWYYVQSRFRNNALRGPQEIDRQVVAISFDGSDTVENIERFGLEEGRVIALSRRVTDSNIKGISFIRQLFGNLGRLDIGGLLGE